MASEEEEETLNWSPYLPFRLLGSAPDSDLRQDKSSVCGRRRQGRKDRMDCQPCVTGLLDPTVLQA